MDGANMNAQVNFLFVFCILYSAVHIHSLFISSVSEVGLNSILYANISFPVLKILLFLTGGFDKPRFYWSGCLPS